jgi:hypothetical protein
MESNAARCQERKETFAERVERVSYLRKTIQTIEIATKVL